MSDAVGTSAGTGGEDVQVRSQPPPARTPQQQSDALDARVAEKRARAEQPANGARQHTPKADADKQRGPDGKFLKGAASVVDDAQSGDQRPPAASQTAKDGDAAPEGKLDDKKAAEPSAELVKLKADHERVTKEHATLKQRDEQWTALAEQVSARLKTQSAYIAKLEAALQEKGGSIDPRDLEIARYQEREHAQTLAQQRAEAQRKADADAQAEAQRAQERQSLENDAKAALTKHPELLEPTNQADLVKYLRLVYRGADPTEAADMVGAQVKQRAGQPAATNIPRTLAGKGTSSGGPKLKDPRDIADKWKRIGGFT